MEKITSHTHFKKILSIILIGVVLLIVNVCFSSYHSTFPSISKDTWQAVFLENNQVYFGKLSNEDNTYVTLTHVYYLRAADSLTKGSASQSIDLVKLGGEFHGPEDKMFIAKDKILFWENLTNTSSVVKTITSNQN